MSFNIHISPEDQEHVEFFAARRGISVDEYLSMVISERLDEEFELKFAEEALKECDENHTMIPSEGGVTSLETVNRVPYSVIVEKNAQKALDKMPYDTRRLFVSFIDELQGCTDPFIKGHWLQGKLKKTFSYVVTDKLRMLAIIDTDRKTITIFDLGSHKKYKISAN